MDCYSKTCFYFRKGESLLHTSKTAKASLVPKKIMTEEPIQMIILSNCFPDLFPFCIQQQIFRYNGVRQYINLVKHILGGIRTDAY